MERNGRRGGGSRSRKCESVSQGSAKFQTEGLENCQISERKKDDKNKKGNCSFHNYSSLMNELSSFVHDLKSELEKKFAIKRKQNFQLTGLAIYKQGTR